MPPTSDLITTRQALTILGRTNPSTISRLVALQRLTPAAKAPGLRGAFLFHRTDIEQLALEFNGDGNAA